MNTGCICNLCGKEYRIRENFKKHLISCKLLHCDVVDDSVNVKELYIAVKQIALKCQRLEDEVSHLKQQLNTRQKRNIMEILNKDPRNARRLSFRLWAQGIVVSREHLEEVFEGSLISGIKSALKPHLCGDIIPFRAFREKNTLYIYDDEGYNRGKNENEDNDDGDRDDGDNDGDRENGDEDDINSEGDRGGQREEGDRENRFYDKSCDNNKKWRAAPPGVFDSLVKNIERQFLQIFVAWQKENQEQISRSEKLKDDEIQYMIKICSYKSSLDKASLIKKWIMSVIEEDATGVIVEY